MQMGAAWDVAARTMSSRGSGVPEDREVFGRSPSDQGSGLMEGKGLTSGVGRGAGTSRPTAFSLASS